MYFLWRPVNYSLAVERFGLFTVPPVKSRYVFLVQDDPVYNNSVISYASNLLFIAGCVELGKNKLK